MKWMPATGRVAAAQRPGRIDSFAAPTDPEGCMYLKLRQLARLVAVRYDTEVGKFGLRATQYVLLDSIEHLGPIRPVDLASAMKLDASTLSRNLRPLFAAGWVVQGPGADARSYQLSATAAGRAKRAEAQGAWRCAQAALAETLQPDRMAVVHAMLDEAVARLDPE